jgi:hypothetical protein
MANLTGVEIRQKAYDLGASNVDRAINWIWAVGFPTKESAETFIQWLEDNNYEHRGIYPARGTKTTYDIRYR